MNLAVHRGTLENGMSYWVRSHATPPGKIMFLLHVDSGSLNEVDGQEGLAHYLEHMAFRETKNFLDVLSYFESIGLSFGQHQNASTGFNQTNYYLSLPDTKIKTLDKGLHYLADVAFQGILFGSVDKERGVILEETRARKGVMQRLNKHLYPFLLPGSRVAYRFPIGQEEAIKSFQQEDLLAYYSTWYHPAKMTLLAVGDAPVETIVTAIKHRLGSWQRQDPVPQNLNDGIQPYRESQALVLTDPELKAAQVEIRNLISSPPRKKVGDYRQSLIADLGVWMMNRRMKQTLQEGISSYQEAQTQVSRSLLGHHMGWAMARAKTTPENWAKAFQELMAHIQAARLHGFTDKEFDRVKKAVLASVEYKAQTENTWDMRSLIMSMKNTLSYGELPRSALQTLGLLHKLLLGITLKEVNTSFATYFKPGKRKYVLILPKQKTIPNSDDVLNLVQKAQPVMAWKDKERPTALLEKKPEPGKIKERREFEPLQVTHVTFENNVKLNYRFMDFKKTT